VWSSVADAARITSPKEIFHPRLLGREVAARVEGWKALVVASRRLGAQTVVNQS
jgi:hypothetical protein